MLKGIGGSAGYGIGKVVIISDGKPEYKQHTVTDTDAENAFIEKFCRERGCEFRFDE